MTIVDHDFAHSINSRKIFDFRFFEAFLEKRSLLKPLYGNQGKVLVTKVSPQNDDLTSKFIDLSSEYMDIKFVHTTLRVSL